MKKTRLKSPSKDFKFHDEGMMNDSIQRGKKRLQPTKRIRKQDLDIYDDEY